MTITPKGKAFVERWKVVEAMVKAGTPFFAAMAVGLEDDDWTLVFAATHRLAHDVHAQDSGTIFPQNQQGPK